MQLYVTSYPKQLYEVIRTVHLRCVGLLRYPQMGKKFKQCIFKTPNSALLTQISARSYIVNLTMIVVIIAKCNADETVRRVTMDVKAKNKSSGSHTALFTHSDVREHGSEPYF